MSDLVPYVVAFWATPILLQLWSARFHPKGLRLWLHPGLRRPWQWFLYAAIAGLVIWELLTPPEIAMAADDLMAAMIGPPKEDWFNFLFRALGTGLTALLAIGGVESWMAWITRSTRLPSTPSETP